MRSVALQDLEPQQLLLFVQSFGIPVSSMSKLLQYLDQAVSHDPQTLEQNIMDKSEPPLYAAFTSPLRGDVRRVRVANSSVCLRSVHGPAGRGAA